MTWHGGPVEHRPRVYLIFYGPKWATDPTHEKVREDVVRTVGAFRGSSFQTVLTQYWDATGHVTGDVRLSGVWLNRATPTEDLGDSKRDVENNAREVARAISLNHWHNSPDAQFLILLQAGSRGRSYCANNVNTTLKGHAYVLAEVPWLGSRGNFCYRKSLAKPYGSTVSHEYAEMVTDPLANAWARGNPAGHHHEIADICNLNRKVRGMWMQTIWSNRSHSCVV